MKGDSNKTRKYRNAALPARRQKKRGCIKSDNLSANYELMLRLYLLNKEQASVKQELKYYKSAKKAAKKVTPLSAWANILHVISKANGLINYVAPPKIALVEE